MAFTAEKTARMQAARRQKLSTWLPWTTLVQRTHVAVSQDLKRIGLKRAVGRTLVFHILNAFLDHSLLGLLDGKRVIWRGFGTFYVKRHKMTGHFEPGKHPKIKRDEYEIAAFKMSTMVTRPVMNREDKRREFIDYCKKKYGNSMNMKLYNYDKYEKKRIITDKANRHVMDYEARPDLPDGDLPEVP